MVHSSLLIIHKRASQQRSADFLQTFCQSFFSVIQTMASLEASFDAIYKTSNLTLHTSIKLVQLFLLDKVEKAHLV